MAIVLNEYEWAERMIADRALGNRPTETLSRVAKYYYENKYSKREVRRFLDQFLMQCDPDASLFMWSDTLDRIAKNAYKYPLVQIDGIPVTQLEFSLIKTLKTERAQRLAFTLLCVSKYWDIISSNNNHWVNTCDSEIRKMANVSVSSKTLDLIYGSLRDAELIRFSRKIDNLNVQVLFQDCDGEPVMLVKDFRNLGYQYSKYFGGPYFECKNCGIVTKMNDHNKFKSRLSDFQHSGRGRKQQYCPSCAAAIRTQNNVNAVMRQRQIHT